MYGRFSRICVYLCFLSSFGWVGCAARKSVKAAPPAVTPEYTYVIPHNDRQDCVTEWEANPTSCSWITPDKVMCDKVIAKIACVKAVKKDKFEGKAK